MAREKLRLLLNGKKAHLPEIRTSVAALRDQGHHIEVRVTWEQGDIHRFVHEAVHEGIPRIVAGGGDGTINETVDALANVEQDLRPTMAILPLGTANDFAASCNIPHSPHEALRLAAEGRSFFVDIGKANERHFLNVATGGFGAQVTTETSPQLKNFIGGGAYTLTGLIKALSFTPLSGVVRTALSEDTFEMIAGAVCNGRQAGGGQILAPSAYINDGMFDIVIISTFPPSDLDIVISEILNPEVDGQYIRRFKTQWIETASLGNVEQVNLDGEPYSSKKVRFEIFPQAIRLVLPEGCPVIRVNR